MTVTSEYIPAIISVSVFLFALLLIVGIVLYIRFTSRKKTLLERVKQAPRETVISEAQTGPVKGGWFDRFSESGNSKGKCTGDLLGR